MAKGRSISILLFTLFLFLTVFVAITAAVRESDLNFPKKISDWQLEGDPKVFKGDDLYLYIDGGAELYNEYGFAEISVANYVRGDDALTVEAYRMTGNAFGIYSVLCGQNDEAIEVGCGGIYSDYYLLFWSDSYLVAITAQTEFDDNRAQLISIAQALAEGLSAQETPPSLLKLLPEQDRQKSSEKYMVGPVALQNVMPKAAELFSGYKEAASALYAGAEGEECRLLILHWADQKAALDAFGRAMAKASDDHGISASVQGEYIVVLRGTSCKKMGVYLEEFRRKQAAN